jgi:hypothetical protein
MFTDEQTNRWTDGHLIRQTDEQTGRPTDRIKDGLVDGRIDYKLTDRKTNARSDRLNYRVTNRWTVGLLNRRTDKQKDKQIGRGHTINYNMASTV